MPGCAESVPSSYLPAMWEKPSPARIAISAQKAAPLCDPRFMARLGASRLKLSGTYLKTRRREPGREPNRSARRPGCRQAFHRMRNDLGHQRQGVRPSPASSTATQGAVPARHEICRAARALGRASHMRVWLPMQAGRFCMRTLAKSLPLKVLNPSGVT
jgi:hypothetical protein